MKGISNTNKEYTPQINESNYCRMLENKPEFRYQYNITSRFIFNKYDSTSFLPHIVDSKVYYVTFYNDVCSLIAYQ